MESSADPHLIGARASGARLKASQKKARSRLVLVNAAKKHDGQKVGRLNRQQLQNVFECKRPLSLTF